MEASHVNEWVQEDSEVVTFRSCVRVGLTILKSIVCIKQVPQVSELKFDTTKKTLIQEGVHNEINPFDRRALTYATELKRKYGGEVIVMTMGPPQAKEALIEALAMGADRALHLLDRAFAGSDTLATSRALSLAIERERPFDLILCGKYSVDAETGHVGPEVAQFLELPHASGATSVEFSLPSSKATCPKVSLRRMSSLAPSMVRNLTQVTDESSWGQMETARPAFRQKRPTRSWFKETISWLRFPEWPTNRDFPFRAIQRARLYSV